MSENEAADGDAARADAGGATGADVDDVDTDADTDADSGANADADADGSDAGRDLLDGTDAGDAPDPSQELVERIREADPESVAREVAALRERAEDAEAALLEREAEIDDLESKLKRERADFQNYKKRMEKRREQERERATEDLVERLLDVRDNLARALDQGEDADIRGGVESTLSQFDRVLDEENVDVLDPDPGSEVDPQRHEVLLRVESDREPGTIDEVHRPGYEMAGKVLRPAQVTVAERTGDDGEREGDDVEDEADDVEDERDDGGEANAGSGGSDDAGTTGGE